MKGVDGEDFVDDEEEDGCGDQGGGDGDDGCDDDGDGGVDEDDDDGDDGIEKRPTIEFFQLERFLGDELPNPPYF